MRHFVQPAASIASLSVMLAAAIASAQPIASAPLADRAATVTLVADGLRTGEFGAAFARFDATMRAALPEPKLGELRTALEAQVGTLRSCDAPRSAREAAHVVMRAACRFERASLDLVVAFDGDDRIAGLRVVPPETTPAPAPTTAAPEGLVQREVTIGEGGWALPGTLTLPKGEGPFPAVVLVHGSGPHDRDETIGPNRPFRDIAEGLGARGVAVLRYEKRSKVHGAKLMALPSFTVDDETVDDAVHAISFARAAEGVDPARVFVLGHSLGGMLAPRIAQRAPALAGVVILAGSARPLQRVLEDQLTYLEGIESGAAAREQIGAMRKEAARIDAITPQTSGLVLGAPAAYWLDLAEYEPAVAARALPQRLLVLHGERDYQVTAADYAVWREALAGRRDAQLRAYAKLNHLFIAGEGRSTPAEYQTAGRVADEVIDDISAFVMQGAATRTD